MRTGGGLEKARLRSSRHLPVRYSGRAGSNLSLPPETEGLSSRIILKIIFRVQGFVKVLQKSFAYFLCKKVFKVKFDLWQKTIFER